MQKLITWFRENVFPGGGKPEPDLRQTGVRVRPVSDRTGAIARQKPQVKPQAKPDPGEDPDLSISSEAAGRIEDAGPGKNVFVRSKYVSGDAGTQDSLKIIDEDELEIADEEGGIDPYNTGHFKMGDNWKKNFRK